jgi:hypothetical protein
MHKIFEGPLAEPGLDVTMSLAALNRLIMAQRAATLPRC